MSEKNKKLPEIGCNAYFNKIKGIPSDGLFIFIAI